MAITFTQFLSRIDEANISGSRPRPKGRDVLTPEQRASSPTRRRTTPPQTTWRAPTPTEPTPNKPRVKPSYFTVVAPEPKKQQPKKPEPKKETPKPQRVLAPWIPGLPSRAAMRVNEPPRIKVTRRGPKKSRKKKKTPIQLNLFGDDNN